MSVLGSAVIFLAATVIAVPIFKKLKLGAILGYLVAGLVIGPQVMNWVNDPVTILHFAELGVVLLLFVIGLELQPEKLWKMRNQILFTGGGATTDQRSNYRADFAFCVGIFFGYIVSRSFVTSTVFYSICSAVDDRTPYSKIATGPTRFFYPINAGFSGHSHIAISGKSLNYQ